MAHTHRIAISNQRITAFDGQRVTFKVKDYRKSGPARFGSMTLPAAEFMRRFLCHVLPDGFHRIRHVGFLANTQRAKQIARARVLLADRMPTPAPTPAPPPAQTPEEAPVAQAAPAPTPCPCCGGRMILFEIIERASYLRPRRSTTPAVGINSS